MKHKVTGLTGVELIARERNRQIRKKGWTLKHDDCHTAGDLAVVASHCALDGTDAEVDDALDRGDWGIRARHGIHGKDPNEIHLLAIAGALIAAEIDRIQRREAERTRAIERLEKSKRGNLAQKSNR